jgi:hypothetical protein
MKCSYKNLLDHNQLPNCVCRRALGQSAAMLFSRPVPYRTASKQQVTGHPTCLIKSGGCLSVFLTPSNVNQFSWQQFSVIMEQLTWTRAMINLLSTQTSSLPPYTLYNYRDPCYVLLTRYVIIVKFTFFEPCIVINRSKNNQQKAHFLY